MFPLYALLACALALNAAARASQAHFDAFSLQDSQYKKHGDESSFYFDLDALRLVQLLDDDEPQWLTERQKLKLKASGIDFFDITDDQLLGPTKAPKQHFTYPDLNGTKATKIVTSIIANLSVAEPKANLNHLSSFWTRFYNSPSGKASSEWLAAKISDYVVQYQSEEDERNITVALIQHKFLQNSVVVRIAPENASESDPITVVGAHCDSLNRFDPLWRAPGADDDGSGTVAILESLRGILQSGYVPTSPLEFHFYAGEEGGLLGSQAIAASFEAAGKNVRGMQQLDTIAWVKTGTREAIAVYTNMTDGDLTKFQKGLVEKYLDLPWVDSDYPGRAASDHFSWTRAGYQTCHVTEAKFQDMNPNLHTANDRINISVEFSFEHLLEYTKLAAAFAVELSNY